MIIIVFVSFFIGNNGRSIQPGIFRKLNIIADQKVCNKKKPTGKGPVDKNKN